jgi:hypothetical protein
MKFVKGAIIGSMATATAMMIYKDMNKNTKTKVIKKGKQFARKMGVL